MPGPDINPKFTPRANENERQGEMPGVDTQQERERLSDGGRNQGRPQDDRDPNSPARTSQPQRPDLTQSADAADSDRGDNDRDPQRQLERDMETGGSRYGEGPTQTRPQGNKPGQQPRQI